MGYDSDRSTQRPNPARQAGVQTGLAAGTGLVCLHLLLLLVNRGGNDGDLLAWGIQLGVYFFASRTAAESAYRQSVDDLDATNAIVPAAVGATLTTSLLVWAYIVLRGVVRDAFGVQIFVEPVSLYCLVVIDALLALGLGAFGGQHVLRKYRGSTDYR